VIIGVVLYSGAGLAPPDAGSEKADTNDGNASYGKHQEPGTNRLVLYARPDVGGGGDDDRKGQDIHGLKCGWSWDGN
jgi:hypothetical protein